MPSQGSAPFGSAQFRNSRSNTWFCHHRQRPQRWQLYRRALTGRNTITFKSDSVLGFCLVISWVTIRQQSTENMVIKVIIVHRQIQKTVIFNIFSGLDIVLSLVMWQGKFLTIKHVAVFYPLSQNWCVRTHTHRHTRTSTKEQSAVQLIASDSTEKAGKRCLMGGLKF